MGIEFDTPCTAERKPKMILKHKQKMYMISFLIIMKINKIFLINFTWFKGFSQTFLAVLVKRKLSKVLIMGNWVFIWYITD